MSVLRSNAQLARSQIGLMRFSTNPQRSIVSLLPVLFLAPPASHSSFSVSPGAAPFSMSAAVSPSPPPSPLSPLALLPPLLFFLDIDGVLNRLEPEPPSPPRTNKGKKGKKSKREKEIKTSERLIDGDDSAEAASDAAACAATHNLAAAPPLSLSCAPSLAEVAAHVQACELGDSIDATLLHNLCLLCHVAAGCTEGASAAYSCHPSAAGASAALSAPVSSFCAISRCSLSPLDSTPDLGGWGTRLDEIFAYLQLQLPGEVSILRAVPDATVPSSAPLRIVLSSTWRLQPDARRLLQKLLSLCGLVAPADAPSWQEEDASTQAPSVATTDPTSLLRFLVLDDMDLFGPLRMRRLRDSNHAGSSLSPELRLMEHAEARTVHLNGEHGLDAGALQRALPIVQRAHAPATSVLDQFSRLLSRFDVPRPPPD